MYALRRISAIIGSSVRNTADRTQRRRTLTGLCDEIRSASSDHDGRPEDISGYHERHDRQIHAVKPGDAAYRRFLVDDGFVHAHATGSDYEGFATDLDERARFAADLNDGELMILRNHGTLAIGRSSGEVRQNIYQLETACSIQVRSLSAGIDGVLIASDEAQQEVRQQIARIRTTGSNVNRLADTVWAAALRRLAREDPGFDC